ncbi:MAG: HIT domain-containing protein [Patescibacteria group bacterium]|nr:HIT domain-containing protein [Patescibacteria group bacterium]
MKKQTQCVFCKIANGSLSCYKVFENDKFLAFLDINPRVLGHTLVIPKKHYRWVYEVEPVCKYWQVVYQITQAMIKVLKPEFVNYFTHGLEIAHAHIHVLPRTSDELSIAPPPRKYSEDLMNQTANRLCEELMKETS